MKRYLLLLLVSISIGFTAKAAPGDTTWVQGNIANLSWYGNYDTVIAFPHPGATYRKIYMIFTLGKYICPAGSSYCGDWDYTVTNYLMTPGGDTLEISRLITPYANAGAPRTPWTWKQHYVYDVTDYAMLLHDSAAIRINYSGYSGGFTANIRFAFIEGTPDRNVLAIHKLWDGYFAYGDTTHHDSNNINVHFPTVIDTAPALTHFGELKFTVTGHGSDANYCNEFCSHDYHVYLNGGNVDNYTIWRNNCGMNELSPQSGTWLYERANWCPGALVYSNHHNLPGITAGSFSAVGLQFDSYISNGGAGYGTDGQLFYYGAFNKTLDASLDNIIAPTRDENFFRENPICGNPIIHVKNTGATVIDSISFIYGVTSVGAMLNYTWIGTLDPLKETDVVMPPLPVLDSIASPPADTATFKVWITSVNGVADNDRLNDTLRSQFISGPKWPYQFKIVFTTNNEAIATGSTISETSWFIFDINNTIVKSRANVHISTVYTDTISLPPGCYRFVMTDSSCDGLNWWANSGTGITSGALSIRKMNNFAIPMNGYYTTGTFNNDFGCGFTQQFTIADYPTAITNISDMQAGIDAYPNPAQNTVSIDLNGMNDVKGVILIYDALGRVVSNKASNAAHQDLDVSMLTNGVYTITYIGDNNPGNKLVTRLLIQK